MKTQVLLVMAGCATSSQLPPVRFANAPAVHVVDDRRDVRAKPEERGFLHMVYHYDGVFQRRLSRALELPRARRALGVNAVDEVPDSTWFTNRIGVRDLTPDEIRIGPVQIDSPELHKPWTVRSTKSGGSEIGFIITDARGEKFLLKFDPVGQPEIETATHAIVDRLLWACGYNVTDDQVVYFRRSDLVLAPDATIKDDIGKRKLTPAEMGRRLDEVENEPDGRIRALASRWLDGKPLGGHPAEGVRGDDPNDRIPHELRRDLRGSYPILAWLDHVDIQESNYIDLWVKDPRDPKRHYVEHYMIDFGKSLGAMATTGHDPRHGHDYVIDLADMSRSLVTGGLVERSWEGRGEPALRGVGLFDAESFDPGSWKPDSPAYVPLLTADRIDKLWGSRIVIRFTREQIRAAVDAGRLSDPRAAEYITDVLVARQRETARYWFRRTSPLEHVEARDGGVCFDDPMVVYRLETAAATSYAATAFDHEGRSLGGGGELAAAETGRTCSGALPLAPGGDGYTIVRVETHRADASQVVFVHLARDPRTGAPRVVGIWRP